MTKSELSTREWTLASVGPGEVVEVLDVLGEHPEQLLVHGVRRGVSVIVEGDAPFGGPRIVRVGSARVAIDRSLAGTVRIVRAATATARDRQ